MVTSCTTTFNMWKFYVSPTQCIYASLNILDQTSTFLPTNINWLVSTTVTPFRLVMRCLFSVSLWRWHRHGIPPPKKKTSSFKHAAWSKDSILCFWRDMIFSMTPSGHTELLIRSGYAAILFATSIGPVVAKATWRHCLSLYRSRSCADVLRGERADVTDFFSFLVTLVDEVRGQA